MGQEGVMIQARMFSVEYKGESVAMVEMPGVSISKIAGDAGGLCWETFPIQLMCWCLRVSPTTRAPLKA